MSSKNIMSNEDEAIVDGGDYFTTLPNGEHIKAGECKDGARVSVQDITDFITMAKKTILPFNQLAYETILNIVELAVIRDVASGDIIAKSEVHRQRISDQELANDVAKIIDDVEAELNKG